MAIVIKEIRVCSTVIKEKVAEAEVSYQLKEQIKREILEELRWDEYRNRNRKKGER